MNEIANILAIENPIAKRIAARRNPTPGMEISICVKDGKTYFSSRMVSLAIGSVGQVYVKSDTNCGFTYDGKTIKYWFGKNPFHNLSEDDISKLMNHLGLDWIQSKDFNSMYYHYKSVVLKILQGKITNFEDLYKVIMKSMRINNCSPKLFETVLNHMNRFQISQLVSVTENHGEQFIAYMKPDKNLQILEDTIQQAKLLGEKIDLRWSNKRINEVHTDFTRRIMFYEADTVKNVDFTIPEVEYIAKERNFEYISNNRRLFEEGMMQKHCVFTNYSQMCIDKRYLVFNIDGYTLGVNVNYFADQSSVVKTFTFSQLFGKFNAPAPLEIDQKAKEFVEDLNSRVTLN
jgi:hypothetical protein